MDPRRRPTEDEQAPVHAAYIQLVPDGDVLRFLERQGHEAVELFESFGEERGGHRYAPGKWSVKELAGHLVDVERICATRAMRLTRGEQQAQPGFDEEEYVTAAGFDRRPLADIVAEYRASRAAHLLMFAGLADEALANRGRIDTYTCTAGSLPWMIAGHERHHLNVLRERYA